jgi:hypothetical protein
MSLTVDAVEPGTPVYITQRYGRRRNKIVGTVLRDLGSSLEIRTDGGQAYFSRSEISLLDEPLHPLFPLRMTLPYGKWVCADGREVLFNRDFQPIWERLAGGISRTAARDSRCESLKETRLFGDHNPPWQNSRTFRRCLEALRAFGVSENGSLAVETGSLPQQENAGEGSGQVSAAEPSLPSG